MKKILLIISLIGLVFIIMIGFWIGFDLYTNSKIIETYAKDDYAKTLENPINDILISFEEGDSADLSKIGETLAYINGRYDCSDFRLPSLIRILKSHHDKLPEEVKEDIKETLTGFKYWMDQAGDDSMCYWSENHQILFAASEYIIGDHYGDDIFSNMNISGKDHSDLGKSRVLTWLEQRFLYGFTEWYSSTYYVEDIAALSILIDFAPDEDIRNKAKMIMDLLIYDLATQNYKGTFTATSGRMYESAKMSGRHGSMKESISVIWPDYNDYINVSDFRGIEANFKYIKNYDLPQVLVNIGYDQKDINIYKASNGLNLSEYEGESLVGQEDPQIMMQFASEAFTNPQVMENTIEYVNRTGMLTNEFLKDLKLLNLGVLKSFKLYPALSKLLGLMYDGTAIQRANTYMYRTPTYAMSTTQAYHPGTFGDQHSLFSLTINNDFNIFNQHPAAPLSEDGALGSSPNYWVGNGYHPHTVQNENINLSIYMLPEKVNQVSNIIGMTRKIENYTHSFFPRQYMDHVIIDENYAFGKIQGTYLALIGKNTLSYKPVLNTEEDQDMNLVDDYDLIQEGRETYWITEVGTDETYTSFEDFIKSIKSNPVHYMDGSLSYKNLELEFKGDFLVAGQVMDLEYDRFESKYSTTKGKADEIHFEFDGQSLTLDFNNNVRLVRN